MFGKMRAIVATAAIAGVVALAGASEASAVRIGTLSTPTGSGSMAFTATAASSKLTSVSGAVLQCAVSQAGANISTGLLSTSYPTTVGTVQPIFNGGGSPPADCVGPSGFLFGVTCTNTAQLQVTGPPVAGTTPGRLTNISCTINFTGVCSATVTGTVQGSYTNPTAGTPGRLTIFAAGQALTAGSGCPANLLPAGAATFSNTSGGDLVYTLDGANTTHPVIST